MGLVNLVFTVVAMLFIDKLGRKPLLVTGMAGMAVCLFVLVFGFKSATYSIDDKSFSNLPPEINREALLPLMNKTFENDLEYKSAVKQALGIEMAGKYEAALVTAAARINTTLILIGILGFVSFYAFSIGPVMWVLFSELFPNRIRGIAISFVGLINLIIAFLVQLIFPWQLANLGNVTTFTIYGTFAIIGLLFVLSKVPETKGKSLEELEAHLVS